MATGAFQLHDNALNHLITNAGVQWDSASDFAWVLLDANYTQSDDDTTYGDISANEITDADYAQKSITTRSIENIASSTQIEFESDPADFGDSVTIEAKFLGCVQGTAGSLASGDIVIGVVDLDKSSSSATVSSSNSNFDISPPSTGWFHIVQA